MHAGSNQSPGERVHDALVEAAIAKTEAFKSERLYKRVLAECLLGAEGKTSAERDARARLHPKAIAAEDAWITNESKANIARAESDGLQVRFEEYRTREATARAEMTLR
jgi:hypothetical protein